MVRTSPRLARDVDMNEEAELRRLEGRLPIATAPIGRVGAKNAAVSQVASDNVHEEADPCNGLLVAPERSSYCSLGSGGVMVQGAAQRGAQLESKKFGSGGFRGSSKINKLLPRGGAGLKMKVPKRKDFGAEGDEGDAAHAAAMKEFSVKEFGSSHVQVCRPEP